MRVLIGVLLSSLLLVGCGGSDSPPPPPPPSGSIRIVNGTSYPIDEAYVTPSSSSTWGEIRNAADVPPSYSITIDYLTPGLWDAKLVAYGDSIYYAHASDLNVLSGQTVEFYAVNGDFSGTLDVTNGSAYPITALYVAPTGSGTWGPNQLSASIPSTNTFHVYDLPPDLYDVRCDYSVGSPAVGYSYSITSFSVKSITCY